MRNKLKIAISIIFFVPITMKYWADLFVGGKSFSFFLHNTFSIFSISLYVWAVLATRLPLIFLVFYCGNCF